MGYFQLVRVLWYGKFLYKKDFGMELFFMGVFGIVSLVWRPGHQNDQEKCNYRKIMSKALEK